MLTTLIASRPMRGDARGGASASLLLHGSLLAAGLLLGSQVKDVLPPAAPPEIIYIDPTAPTPTPAPTGRVGDAGSPIAPPTLDAVPVDVTIDVPSLPTSIPTTIPDPSRSLWTGVHRAAPRTGTADGPTGRGAGGEYSQFQVDLPARLSPRSPLPRYPEALRRLALAGTVRMTFVVDTLGRVEMATVRVLEAAHPAFEASVRSTLPRMRFEPARIGDRPVRQLVEFPVAFALEP